MNIKAINIILLAAVLVLIVCCSPRIVAMQPSDPVIPQMPLPEKTTSADKLAEGKSMYEANCAKCHNLYSPAQFTRNQWVPILYEMQRKADLNDAQMTLISDYINSQTH